MGVRVGKWVAGVVGLAGLIGCSDADASKAKAVGGDGAASGEGSVSGNGSGGSASGGTGNAGAAGGAGPLVELPEGSRELDGIVNLVNADAAAQLEEFLFDQSLIHATRRQGLTRPLNLLLDHYTETYDFVFFVTAAELDGVPVAGKFEAVTTKPEPGGVGEIEIVAGGYKTSGRVRGVIGVPYRANYYPPFSHETLHLWAQHLDPSFGFGQLLEEHVGSHWGASSVNGQLGGFDGATLRCATPAGALPPGCTALASGRTRYVVGAFGSFANGFRGQAYAPLELYLMGLLPAAEVPAAFQLLTEAFIDSESYDQVADTLEVEASGIHELAFAEIVGRHGERPLLSDEERDFSAAFVVVSSTPAPDDVMTDVARWAAVFGNRLDYAGWNSFEADTGGLARMNTQLGFRRPVEQPAPEPRARGACDVLAQDCARPELGCYLEAGGICALSGGVELDGPCGTEFACAPGFDCLAPATAPDDFVCKPYCDLTDTTATNACASLCPGNYLRFDSAAGEPLAGICLP